MSNEDEELQAARAEARRQAQALRSFYIHAMVYVTVMAMLLFINITTGNWARGNYWVQWPAVTWGAALVIHAIIAFRGIEMFGRDWEDRKVEEIMRKRRGGN